MATSVILGTAHPHIFALAASAKSTDGGKGKILGVWDDDPARLEASAAKIGAPAIKSLEEALALKPQIGISAAVPGDRAAIAERALAAGVPMLIDKPLAVTHDALQQLIAAQHRYRKPVIVFYPYRGHPHILAAKAALDSGRIGKLIRVFSSGPHKINAANRPAWHWTRAGNGGALIDIGSHHFDIACFFAQSAPNWLTATHGNLSQPQHAEFQDFAHAIMRFPGGAVGHVEVDWVNPTAMKNFGDTRTWLQGTEGKIEIRLGDVQSAEIWSNKEGIAAQPLDLSKFASDEAWAVKLIEDIAADRLCAVPQDEIWRASRVSLSAFDSASRGGQPLTL